MLLLPLSMALYCHLRFFLFRMVKDEGLGGNGLTPCREGSGTGAAWALRTAMGSRSNRQVLVGTLCQ